MESKFYQNSNTFCITELEYNVCVYKTIREIARVDLKKKEELYKALKEEGDGKVCPLLSRSILFGVAYHNSGYYSHTIIILNQCM